VLGLALESTAYVAPDGTLGAQMTATWMQVTQNADGSVIGDLAGYELEYRQLDAMPGTETISLNALTLYRWSPVIPGVAIDVRIRAVDRFGNGGDWSPWVSIVAGDDVTPPPVPSAPIVENWLGLLKNTWDGAFADGSPRPADLDRVEVHLSTIGADFTPDPRPIEDGGTLAGSVFAPGPVFRDTPYGQTQWVRLVAVDTTGNRSGPSAAASGATGQVVSADVFDGAIGTAKLADAAIISAKIADLAVNDAKIGSVSVGKLVAGTMTAAVIMGGRIATADTGPRIELNSLGIYRWATAADGTLKQYVAIDDQGALLVGKYRTGFSGERRIEMGAAGSTGRMDFFAPDGSNAFVQAWTENQTSKVEAIQFGVLPRAWNGVDVDTLWSRINYNMSSGGEYATYKSGTHEFTYDTAAPNSNGKFMIWSSSGRGQNGYERFEIINHGPGVISLVPGSTGAMDIGATIRILDGRGFGLAIRPVEPSGGTQRMELIQWDASSYQRWWASGYDVQSDASTKTGIRPLTESTSLLNELRGTKVKRYRRKGRAERVQHIRTADGGERSRREKVEAPEEIGLLAHEAPARIRTDPASDGTLGIDLYQMGVHTWGAVDELAEAHDELADEVRRLRELVAALSKGDNT
jgi:hypothetical protein